MMSKPTKQIDHAFSGLQKLLSVDTAGSIDVGVGKFQGIKIAHIVCDIRKEKKNDV